MAKKAERGPCTFKPTRRVALIIESQIAPRRRMLEGVARYMQEHGAWDTYLKPYATAYSFADWAWNWEEGGIMFLFLAACSKGVFVPALIVQSKMKFFESD